MKLFLFGYGQMGKEIEKLALERGHKISGICDPENAYKFDATAFADADIAIDYTTPESAVHNMTMSFEANKPIVVGTTGWYEQLDAVKKLCEKLNGTLFYATNFSIGVNVLFEMSELLSKMISQQDSYSVSISETHHTRKKDAPSGTAITLAEILIKNLDFVKTWKKLQTGDITENEKGVIPVYYSRENEVVGSHEIKIQSDIDQITLRHDAFSRAGFTAGTLIATEWVINKKGIFTMKDLFSNIS